ncbi:MAG: hypothetical protein KBC16_02660 [Candidatus Pacebacteria bacterium]|nr:hypothetical protein [Candidatus Paceibacterota bacterium]
MLHLILIGTVCLLLGGFLLLTQFEQKTATRILGTVRGELDHRLTQMAFVARHVDWPAFFSHTLKVIVVRIAHDVAHATLLAVRFMERNLTRFVKYMRSNPLVALQKKDPTVRRLHLPGFMSRVVFPIKSPKKKDVVDEEDRTLGE